MKWDISNATREEQETRYRHSDEKYDSSLNITTWFPGKSWMIHDNHNKHNQTSLRLQEETLESPIETRSKVIYRLQDAFCTLSESLRGDSLECHLSILNTSYNATENSIQIFQYSNWHFRAHPHFLVNTNFLYSLTQTALKITKFLKSYVETHWKALRLPQQTTINSLEYSSSYEASRASS